MFFPSIPPPIDNWLAFIMYQNQQYLYTGKGGLGTIKTSQIKLYSLSKIVHIHEGEINAES